MSPRLPVGPAVELGPGDDAALVTVQGGRVIATTDVLVEGRHFRRDWSGPYDIGRKAAAQNLADVVAMGGRPTALLIGFAGPADTPVGWAEAFADGLRDECELVEAGVAGGDTVSAPLLVLSVTALGELLGERPLTRSGARPGDVVAVRGRLGWASAGLELLLRGVFEPVELIYAHRRPQPPYEAGMEALKAGATALLDVSDGLVQDLGHIARASDVRIDLSAAAVRALAPEVPDRLRHALTGGEDHAFAATFPPEAVPGAGWAVVGRVTDGAGVVVDGRPYEGHGWDHFLTE